MSKGRAGPPPRLLFFFFSRTIVGRERQALTWNTAEYRELSVISSSVACAVGHSFWVK